jgi:hypothetical protein
MPLPYSFHAPSLHLLCSSSAVSDARLIINTPSQQGGCRGPRRSPRCLHSRSWESGILAFSWPTLAILGSSVISHGQRRQVHLASGNGKSYEFICVPCPSPWMTPRAYDQRAVKTLMRVRTWLCHERVRAAGACTISNIQTLLVLQSDEAQVRSSQTGMKFMRRGWNRSGPVLVRTCRASSMTIDISRF